MKVKQMQEIARNLKEKQSWVRKGLLEFLEKWENITSGTDFDFEGFAFLDVHREECPSGIDEIYQIKLGSKEIWQYPNIDYGYKHRESLCYPDIPIKVIRKITEDLPENIENHFEMLKEKSETLYMPAEKALKNLLK